jgi:hypothetical protein
MSSVLECDICGDTYQKRRHAAKFVRIDVPFRYKLWTILPWNRDKVGWVKQDICRDCRHQFEAVVEYLKEEADNE